MAPIKEISYFSLILTSFCILMCCVNVSGEEELKIEKLKVPSTCDFAAEDNDLIQIHYRGTLQDTGAEFDSSYKRKEPLSFRLGQGQVIKGWDQGLIGMCIGEKRRLTIPPHLAYGDSGMPPTIPGGATLVFETELVDID